MLVNVRARVVVVVDYEHDADNHDDDLLCLHIFCICVMEGGVEFE